MLKKYDIFDLTLMDGGAFFFTNEHLGGVDTETFADAFESGKLLAPWKKGSKKKTKGVENIDWVASYDDSKPGGYWHQNVEQHVWLHRLYFLLPLAQQYLRTGEKKWAKAWFTSLSTWIDEHPEPTSRPDSSGVRFIWGDMQQTWRLLVLIHSIAMFGGDKNVFTEAQWTKIYKMLGSHAKRITKEAKRQIVKGGGGNHFLQKGMALIYAGTLFPELENSDYMTSLGRRVVRWHLIRKTFKDGASVEASPSYSHFISRLYLDAYLLLRDNGHEQVKDLEKSIISQYEFNAQTASPNWKTLQLSDSFAMDVLLDLEIVNKIFPVNIPERKESVCFPESQFAILRGDNTVIYIDAMVAARGHIHAGKPNILAYYNDEPVLVDSGCVNYDRAELRYGYLKKRDAHNVVKVEPVLDDEFVAPIERKIKKYKASANGGSITATHKFAGEGAKYLWQRTIVKKGDTITITDRLKSKKIMKCVQLFHLGKSKTRRIKGKVVAHNDVWKLECECQDAAGKMVTPEVTRRPALDDTNKQFKSPEISFKQSGRTVVFKTVLQLESSK